MNEKYEKVMNLYKEGLSYNQIAKALNMNKSTVAYYVNRFDNEKYLLDKELKDKQQLEYEKIVCDVFLKQKNLHKTCKMLNKRPTNTNYKKISQILNKNNIKIDEVVYYLNKTKKKLGYEDIFKENSSLSSSSHLRDYIFKFNLKEKKCEECGISSWNGKDIGFQVHHINGMRTDNRIENLKLLCPNCHSQTDNFCGRKKRIVNNTEKLFKEKKKKIAIPDKDSLLETFKEKGSFKQVGIFYGVSDNAVKKWFKKYNLPSSSPEVRKMIVEIYGKQPQWYTYMDNRDFSRSIEKRGYKIEIYDKEGKYLTTCASMNEASRYTNISPNTMKRYFDGYSIKNTNFIMKKI